MSRQRRAIVTLGVVAALVVVVSPTPLVAHSGLRVSMPLDGATLGAAPTEVVLTFAERPDATLASVTVVDRQGVARHSGSPRPVPDDPLSLTVPLAPLTRGVYVVHWRVVSAVDGHASRGSLAFGVQDDPSGVADARPPSSELDPTEVAGRTLALAGLAMLLGACAAWLARLGSIGAQRVVARLGCISALLGGALIAVAQWRSADVALATLLATSVGRSLAWRMLALLVTAVAVAGTTRWPRVAWPVVGSGAVAVIALHVVAGHASAARWPVVPTVGLQIAHVAGIGLWLGTLAVVVWHIRATSTATGLRLRQLSSMAAWGLALVVATGVVRSLQEVDRWSDLWTSVYGGALALKVALLVVLAALGARNRWRNLDLAAMDAAPLRRTAAMELALSAVVFVAAGVLAASPPPAAARAVSGWDVAGSDVGTTTTARLTTPADGPGPNRYAVTLADYDSGETIAADRVQMRFTSLDDPTVGVTTLPLRRSNDGEYVGTGAQLAFDGRWRLDVLAERGHTSVTVPLDVETRVRPQRVSVFRPPGQRASYTVEIRDLGFVEVSPSDERVGSSSILVRALNVVFEPLAIDHISVIEGPKASATPLSVTRLDRHHFEAPVTWKAGTNRLAIFLRTTDGTRLRATFAIDASLR